MKGMTLNLRDYLELWRVSKRRLNSEQDYREFQAFQANQLIKYLSRQGVSIRGRSLMDLGSGIAGYSRAFAQHGARVMSVDLVHPPNHRTFEVLPIQASALALPLPSATVDIVFCASLIEHVAEPQVVMSEIERVLKPGGFAYVSFPPYYSPVGGHEFAPFHYLGERLALRLVRRHHIIPAWVRELYGSPDEVKSFANLYKGWGLYKMTIRKFRRLLSRTDLVCVNMATRYMPVSFVRWPVMGELLTWHAQFLLLKPLYSGDKSNS